MAVRTAEALKVNVSVTNDLKLLLKVNFLSAERKAPEKLKLNLKSVERKAPEKPDNSTAPLVPPRASVPSLSAAATAALSRPRLAP